MLIITEQIKKNELLSLSEVVFDDEMIKAVADVRQGLLAIDAELHADLEELLLLNGSAQEDLWGINLYPEETEDFIEYDSLINIRPRQNNRSRGIENPEIRQNVNEVVYRWID